MAAPHNDRGLDNAGASLLPSQGDQAAFLAYQAALFHTYHPFDLSASQRPASELFTPTPYSGYDVDPRLGPAPLPLPPPGLPPFGLPSPLLYASAPPTYLPGARGSPLLTPSLHLAAPVYHRIYDLEKEAKLSLECPLPADLSTKRRDPSPSVKSEDANSCARGGKKSVRSKAKAKVPKIENQEEEEGGERSRDDVNNNQGRQNAPPPEYNHEKTTVCDLSLYKCQNDADSAINLVKDKSEQSSTSALPDERGRSHVTSPIDQSQTVSEQIKSERTSFESPVLETASQSNAVNLSLKTNRPDEDNDLDVDLVNKTPTNSVEPEEDKSAAVVYHRHDVDIPANLRHASRGEIVMFPLVRNLSRDSIVTSSSASYQPIKPLYSSASSSFGPISSQEALPASSAKSISTKPDVSVPKKVHARTFTPEITIPTTACCSMAVTPVSIQPPTPKSECSTPRSVTTPTTPSSRPSSVSPHCGKRVYATTFTPEVASEISQAGRCAPKRTLSSTDSKSQLQNNEKKRSQSVTSGRKTPEKRKSTSRNDMSAEKKARQESIWGCRAPASPKVQTPVSREGGKIRLAVDWKAAILGTKNKEDKEKEKQETVVKDEVKLPCMKQGKDDEPKPKLEVSPCCMKTEVKVGSCLKDERGVNKASIPVGIAVARQRVEPKPKPEPKPTSLATSNCPDQIDVVTKSSGNMTSSILQPDVKQEITTSVLVTGQTGLVGSWPRDTTPTTPQWFQPTSQQSMAPTYWLGQAPFVSPPIINNLDLTSSLHAPPNVAPPTVVAPSTGYKLAQNPMTGQLFVIPSNNIDVLDPSHLWTTVPAPAALQPTVTGHVGSHVTGAPPTLPQTGLAPSLLATQSNDQPLNLQHNPPAQAALKTSPEQPAADETPQPSSTTDTKPDLNQSQQSFSFSTLPFYYDSTDVQTEVASIAPKTEPVAMQSRGTSPMTVASGSPMPDDHKQETEVDIVHVELDRQVSTQNTAIQTSPDVDQMNEMKEQSSQTSETEKDSHSESNLTENESENDKNHHEMEDQMEVNQTDRAEMTSRGGSVQRRRHSDIQSLIRELMPLANGTPENLTSPLSVQVDDDRIFENSYRNLHSNLSTPSANTPTRRWSELAETYHDQEGLDGLSLLSTIVDKHSDEFRSPDSRYPCGSPRDRLSVGSWERCGWSDVGSPDPHRTYHSPCRTEILSSACNSPTYTTPTRSAWTPASAINLDSMEPAELEMRLKLAELQRKYREKQRELARLQPKRHTSDTSEHKSRSRGSCADDWKKPRKRIKKRHNSTPAPSTSASTHASTSKHAKRKRLQHLEGVTRDLFKTERKREKGLPPVSEAGTLSSVTSGDATTPTPANSAHNSGTEHDIILPEPPSPTKKRKLASSRKPEPEPEPEPEPAPEPVSIGSDTQQQTSEKSEPEDEETKPKSNKSFLDDNTWTIRRSERIFLSDKAEEQSMKYLAAFNSKVLSQINKSAKKSKPKVNLKPKEEVTVKREVISPETIMEENSEEVDNLELPQIHNDDVAEKHQGVEIAENESEGKTEEETGCESDDVVGKADIERSISTTSTESCESVDSDNVPLIKLVTPQKSKQKPMEPVLLDEEDLVEGLRILLFVDDLFYPAQLRPIQPPDIYGVTVIGGRGSNRPQIMTQEELLREAIFDRRPTSRADLVEGARVCAYWSQKFRCLYPGTVATPDPEEELDLTEAEKEMIFVEFDDGDSGRIPYDHIRLLPDDLQEIGENRDKYPLLACERKPRPAAQPDPEPEPEPEPDPEPEPLHNDQIKTDSCQPLDKNEQSKPSSQKKEKKKKKAKDEEGKDITEKKDKHSDEKKKKKKKKDRKDEKKESPRESSDQKTKHKKKKKDKEHGDDEKIKKKVSKEKKKEKDKKRRDTTEDDADGAGGADGATSRMAGNDLSFLPAQQLWRWNGKGIKRYGVKGKVRKIHYKSIIREDEEIKVGDCAVFMSTGRPHLPYVGRIDSFWESWSGAKCVRVKWFYHPEETKTSKRLKDMEGALFQTAHHDDNDVQTISHRCEVLPLNEYLKTEREDDSNDVYYLAGKYDPVGGAIDYEPNVE